MKQARRALVIPTSRLHGERLLIRLAHVALGMQLHVWQWRGTRFGPVGVHAAGSYHYRTYPDGVGKAFDAYGTVADMGRFASYIAHHAPQVNEGIYNSAGTGHDLAIKDGRRVRGPEVYAAVWAAHASHVHCANDGPAGR